MKTLPRRSFFLGIVCLLACCPAALHAQAPKIFVASYGNDANDGSRGSPKRNFQAAHDAVAAKGQIVVLDTAGYGALNITKSLAVTVPPGVNGFVTVSLGTARAITVNVPGSDAVVSLRGLIVEGGADRSTQSPNVNYGILVSACEHFSAEDCTIRNFYDGLIAGAIVNLRLTSTRFENCRYALDYEGANEAVVADCTFYNNGDAIYLASDAGGFVTAVMEISRCIFEQNSTAVRAVGAAFAYVGGCTLGVKTQSINTTALTSGGVYSYGNNQSSGAPGFTGSAPLR